jgi:hypothetical protein
MVGQGLNQEPVEIRVFKMVRSAVRRTRKSEGRSVGRETADGAADE